MYGRDPLSDQLYEAFLLAKGADGKSYEVSRQLAFVADKLEVAEDRVKSGDAIDRGAGKRIGSCRNSLN